MSSLESSSAPQTQERKWKSRRRWKTRLQLLSDAERWLLFDEHSLMRGALELMELSPRRGICPASSVCVLPARLRRVSLSAAGQREIQVRGHRTTIIPDVE